MKVQRYQWEDALIDAEVEGRISQGALLLGLRLAKAILWEPNDKRPSGLYWKNETAAKAVGTSRATFHRYKQSLVETGFFKMVNGNLIATIPQSQVEPVLSQVETILSQVETEKSQVEHPYTEDIYTDDVFNEDKDTEAVADARSSDLASYTQEDDEPVLASYEEPASSCEYKEEARVSQVETSKKCDLSVLTREQLSNFMFYKKTNTEQKAYEMALEPSW